MRDDIDSLLRSRGERWRNQLDSPPPPSFGERDRRVPTRRFAIASFVVVILAALVFVVVRDRAGSSDRVTRAATAPASTGTGTNQSPVGVKNLHDIIGYCPPGILPTDRTAVAVATETAQNYMQSAGRWLSSSVQAAYVVGTDGGNYSAVFNRNVPEACGPKTAESVFVVELVDTSGPSHGSDTHAEVAVSRFADGWRVWGAYR